MILDGFEIRCFGRLKLTIGRRFHAVELKAEPTQRLRELAGKIAAGLVVVG